jgi:hypothetical protein
LATSRVRARSSRSSASASWSWSMLSQRHPGLVVTKTVKSSGFARLRRPSYGLLQPPRTRPFLALVRMGRCAVFATLLEGRAPDAIARVAVGRLHGLHRVEWSSPARGH